MFTAYVLVPSCTKPVPPLGPVITNAAACTVDIIEDVAGGAPNIAQTIADCATTVADIIAVVQALLSNMPETSTTVATRAGRDVARAAYITNLQAWLAAAQVYDGGAR